MAHAAPDHRVVSISRAAPPGWLAVAALALSAIVTGCSLWGYRNKAPANERPSATRATLSVDNHRGNKPPNVLVLLALSGGGSRAAYFSAASMFALQHVFDDVDILSSVDVISSVSGGSLMAAYYCLSRDPDPANAHSGGAGLWTREAVARLMLHDYIWGYRGLVVGGFVLRPQNIPRAWFTAYSRTDTMADVFENGVFEKSSLALRSPTFADLNSGRPYLVLNAANGTEDYGSQHFGRVFTFTQEDFATIGSDINRYPLSYGVMASAAFPGVFHYITLRDFKEAQEKRYLHLFDGGTVDNLGLDTVKRIIRNYHDRSGHLVIIVILVDSFTGGSGADSTRPDVRSFFDHVVDSNFLTTYDTLLASSRNEELGEFAGNRPFRETLKPKPEIIFLHLTFEKIPGNVPDLPGHRKSLAEGLNSIPTNFDLDDDDRMRLDRAAELLVSKNNSCLQQVRQVLLTGEPIKPDPCQGENHAASALRAAKSRAITQ